MNWIEKLIELIKAFFGSNTETSSQTVQTATSSKPAVQQGLKLLRISTTGTEFDGKVGSDQSNIRIKRKQNLYAAIKAELVIPAPGFSLLMYVDGVKQSSVVNNATVEPSNLNKEFPYTIRWPGTNGYPLGSHSLKFSLLDQNGSEVDSRTINAYVEDSQGN